MRNTGTEGAVENVRRQRKQAERRQAAMKADRRAEMKTRRSI